jgi:hypothetical protein
MPRRRGWVWRRGFGGGRGRSHGRRQADVDVDMERDVSPKGTNQTSTGVSWDSAPSSENGMWFQVNVTAFPAELGWRRQRLSWE